VQHTNGVLPSFRVFAAIAGRQTMDTLHADAVPTTQRRPWQAARMQLPELREGLLRATFTTTSPDFKTRPRRPP